MLFLQAIALLQLLISISTNPSDEEIYNRVKNDLWRARTLRSKAVDTESFDWLPNCGKIALGFDPIRGEPVCYSGECRANGFNQPVFDMQYVKTPKGSCVKKLIPENVNVSFVSSLIRTDDGK